MTIFEAIQKAKGTKKAAGINSTSKLFEDEVGAWIPPGIGEGIEKKMPALSADTEKELQGLVDDVNLSVAAEVKGFAGRTSLASAVKSEPPQTITNDNGFTINVYCENRADIPDVKMIARQLGREASLEMRRRGANPIMSIAARLARLEKQVDFSGYITVTLADWTAGPALTLHAISRTTLQALTAAPVCLRTY